jgi:predicted Zn-dependent protease with MMP-like domain
MDHLFFERLVSEALDSLPPEFQEKLSNVAVVIEDLAPGEVLKTQNRKNPYELLGLYVGIPQNKRGYGYSFVLPDRIYIFRRAIEARASTPEEIRSLVRKVVLHEIGHHFGLSEEELKEAMQDD